MRPVVVLPADIDVPMRSTTGIAKCVSGVGGTKSSIVSFCPSRSTCPEYLKLMSRGNVGATDRALPNSPAAVSASIEPSSPMPPNPRCLGCGGSLAERTDRRRAPSIAPRSGHS
jgi:hypothetical protein